MERDVLLCALVALVGWPVVAASALARPSPEPLRPSEAAAQAEQRHWVGLWIGVVPAACAVALLCGWAFAEPDPSDESLGGWRIAAAVACCVPVVRAVVRAMIAAMRPVTVRSAATIGLLRPRVVVDPAFEDGVTRAQLAAVLAHERAHAANRDPLRAWAAQIATDLQWPAISASPRLERWRQALEWARDDDARRDGIAGEDLAAAIVAAVRHQRGEQTSGVGFVGPNELRARVQRLLTDAPAPSRVVTLPMWPVAAIAGAAVFGFAWGDPIVRLIVGQR